MTKHVLDKNGIKMGIGDRFRFDYGADPAVGRFDDHSNDTSLLIVWDDPTLEDEEVLILSWNTSLAEHSEKIESGSQHSFRFE